MTDEEVKRKIIGKGKSYQQKKLSTKVKLMDKRVSYLQNK